LVLLTLLMLAALRSHRDSVGCGIPVSAARSVAVTALRPSIRRTIRAFTFSAYSMIASALAPKSDHQVEAATTLTQGDHEVAGGLGLAQPVCVERVEVMRCAHRQLLDLALRHARAGARRDQLDDLVERRPRALLGDPAAILQQH